MDDKPKSNERKWGRPVLQAGWTAVPSILLEKQHALGLRPVDINVLLQLLRHWWNADQKPYPSKETIAQAMGVTARTVQRSISLMVDMKLIERRKRPGPQGTNEISFDGLIERLEPFAAEAVEERATRTKRRQERQARRKPRRAS
ncbi:MAG: helix-turn-helix domain-containing protein [Myxococcaceae bacterium]|nr:MAG: helix-turn-helix domain-containing protein [Myxococcaceae bacterium]